ncbi:hypothetical protein I3215_21475 [Streptomyces sp. RB110-1]|uniref:hypothetical protein n=1 Tax=Streptomyces TaxID=1883 RepID=UPI0019020F1B|nr:MULTISPECIES: hypothetical protein [Streptomyces]MBK0375437.1 hypothetical protein [Streptomyces sp. RB110-1]MBK0388189.1 hypothetical protein [Streptomyces sp. RB110-2]MCF3170747.1 hypothetical protein [Streptomyces violaceoruber]
MRTAAGTPATRASAGTPTARASTGQSATRASAAPSAARASTGPSAAPAVRAAVRPPVSSSARTPARRPAPPAPSADAVTELARRVREQAHDLVRRLPSADDAEALRRVAQLREQLDGLTAAVVGRACRGPVR